MQAQTGASEFSTNAWHNSAAVAGMNRACEMCVRPCHSGSIGLMVYEMIAPALSRPLTSRQG